MHSFEFFEWPKFHHLSTKSVKYLFILAEKYVKASVCRKPTWVHSLFRAGLKPKPHWPYPHEHLLNLSFSMILFGLYWDLDTFPPALSHPAGL